VADAKTDFFMRLAGFNSYTRLERQVGTATGSFSMVSPTGYQGQLVLGKYFTNWWNMYLAGMYFGNTFKAPPLRTITMETISTYTGSLGSEFEMGDVSLYLQGNYRTLPLLEDLSVSDHRFYEVPVATGQLGLKFKAFSSHGYEMEVDLSAATGAMAGKSTVDQKEVNVTYSLLGRVQIGFGSQKTSGTSSIRFGNDFSSFEMRYGVDLEILVDEYKHDETTYNMSHLYGGLFVKLLP
jgi:hypothetical protein